MPHTILRSKAELDALAKARLDAGDAVGEARAMLAAEGDDLISVQTWAYPTAEAGLQSTYRLNGDNVPARAIELLIASYGASVIGPGSSF